MNAITKTVTLSGGSMTSYEDAIRVVLSRASESISEITRFEVVSMAGSVDSAGLPASFEVTLLVTFIVKESLAHN